MSCSYLCALILAAGSGADTRDIETVRERILTAYAPSNPETLSESVRETMASLQEDGSWCDVDYTDTARSGWVTARHMHRVREMAAAWHADGSPLHHDQGLGEKALRALDFWLEKDLRNPNWWWNEIGAQLTLGPALLMLADTLSPEQTEAGVALLKRSKWERWTGQNLVWGATIQVMRGCLEESPAVIREAYDRLYAEIRVVAPGEEGIQADYSFHQHGPLLYSGGYGRGFAGENARFIHLARGTQFEASEDVLDVMAAYLLDGEQWMVRGGTFDYSGVGREIVRKGHNAGAIRQAATLLSELPLARKQEMTAFAARMRSKDHNPPLAGNRHFWRSDYMAHHRHGYFTSVRMTSARNKRSEVCNSEGRRSHHLADGVTYIYRTGDEYRDIFPVWDWERVPGITCLQTGDWGGKGVPHAKGETAFVGGVSDGVCGLAAMAFERGPLSAKRAWFCFDDIIVCLGSGIASAEAGSVTTSVNQCHLRSEVLVSGHAGALERGDHAVDDVRWVLHDGVGYVFPGGQGVRIGNQPQTGRWSDIGTGSDAEVSLEVFSLLLEHGERPTEATYAYLLCPDTDRGELEKTAADCPVRIVANTPELQAVEHVKKRLLQVAFYEPGSLDADSGRTIAVDQPCLVLVQEEEGGVRISVSNPCNEPLVVNVSVNRVLTGEGCKSAGEGRSMISFELPGCPMAGSSVVKRLRG